MAIRIVAAMIVAGLAAACAPSDPVSDGLIAYYDRERTPDALVVRIAGGGDATLRVGSHALVRREEDDYVVDDQPRHLEGNTYRMTPVAAARSDLIEMSRRAAEALGQAGAEDPKPVTEYRLPDGRVLRFKTAPPPRYELIAGGEEVIAGRKGRVWQVRRVGETEGVSYEAVISTDPALVALGSILAMHLAPADALGVRADPHRRALADLFAKGTMLRFTQRAERDGQVQRVDLFRLKRIEPARLPASEFALPEWRWTLKDAKPDEPAPRLTSDAMPDV